MISASEDAKIEAWRHDVVEEVENLMNGLLSGRVLGNMLTLTRRAVAFTIISSEENSEKEQEERRCNFSSACLHAEVARILFNYHYSRPARTLVQLFLGQFPPADEVRLFFASQLALLVSSNNRVSFKDYLVCFKLVVRTAGIC